jgi:hypothetical protein
MLSTSAPGWGSSRCSVRGRADFAYPRDTLELTDGNLTRLQDAGHITVHKVIDGRRPRTWLSATRAGRTALNAETAALREIIAGLENASRPSARTPTAQPANLKATEQARIPASPDAHAVPSARDGGHPSTPEPSRKRAKNVAQASSSPPGWPRSFSSVAFRTTTGAPRGLAPRIRAVRRAGRRANCRCWRRPHGPAGSARRRRRR